MDAYRKHSGHKRPVRRRKLAPDGTFVSTQPAAVGDILERLLKKTPLGRHMKLTEIWDAWPEIAGPKLAPYGKPRGVRAHTLIIEVASHVRMNQFAYHKWDIVERVNRLYRREMISDIYLLLASDADD